jgi:hypothetical protein
MSKSRGLSAFLLLSVLTTLPAVAGDYDFEIVAATGDIIDGKKLTTITSSGLAFNDLGEVAFRAEVEGGGAGIFTQHRVVALTGDTIDGITITDLKLPVINNSGDVAFWGLWAASTAQGIFKENALVVKDGDVVDGKSLLFVGLPSMNNLGDIVFYASWGIGPGPQGILSPTEALVIFGEEIDGYTMAGFGQQGPTIVDGGSLVFTACYSAPSPTGCGIFTQDSALLRVGETLGGKTLTAFADPRVSDSGKFVVVGLYDGGRGLFTADELIVAEGDVVDGRVMTMVDARRPSINDAEEVVFTGWYTAGSGVFRRDRAVAVGGDEVAGRTIRAAGGAVINDEGQIAFFVDFEDYTDGIVVATRTPQGDTGEIVDTIEDLDLPSGTSTSLVGILEAAINTLDRGNETAAIHQLETFIRRVSAQSGDEIPEDEADALLAAAQAIIDELEGG